MKSALLLLVITVATYFVEQGHACTPLKDLALTGETKCNGVELQLHVQPANRTVDEKMGGFSFSGGGYGGAGGGGIGMGWDHTVTVPDDYVFYATTADLSDRQDFSVYGVQEYRNPVQTITITQDDIDACVPLALTGETKCNGVELQLHVQPANRAVDEKMGGFSFSGGSYGGAGGGGIGMGWDHTVTVPDDYVFYATTADLSDRQDFSVYGVQEYRNPVQTITITQHHIDFCACGIPIPVTLQEPDDEDEEPGHTGSSEVLGDSDTGSSEELGDSGSSSSSSSGSSAGAIVGGVFGFFVLVAIEKGVGGGV